MHVSTKDTFAVCSSHLAVRPENGEVGVDYEIWHVPMLGVIFGPRLFSSSRHLYHV